MAYENVTAPAIPQYDTAAYPYYVLAFNYELDSTDWYQVHFFGSPTAFRYDKDGGYITIDETSHLRQIYDTETAEWVTAVVAAAPTLTPGAYGQTYQRIYTNHDILDDDGNVWLAADSVTPVEEEETEETTKCPWLKSWLAGLVIGLAGKPAPIAPVQKQPVAYLYNGVQLPKLPPKPSNNTTLGLPYDYVIIMDENYNRHLGEEPMYVAVFSTVRALLRNGYVMSDGSVHAKYARETYMLTNGEWERNGYASGIYNTNGIFSTDELGDRVTFWANHNIYNDEDGTIYLAASEPVPVYE